MKTDQATINERPGDRRRTGSKGSRPKAYAASAGTAVLDAFPKSQARWFAVSLAVTNLPSASATSTSMKQSATSRIVGSDSHAHGRASVLRPPWSRRRRSALLIRRRALRGRRRPKAAAAHPQLSPSPDRPAPPSSWRSRSPGRRPRWRAWPVMSAAAIGDRRFVVAADQHAAKALVGQSACVQICGGRENGGKYL
jgi:hypothetical protein